MAMCTGDNVNLVWIQTPAILLWFVVIFWCVFSRTVEKILFRYKLDNNNLINKAIGKISNYNIEGVQIYFDCIKVNNILVIDFKREGYERMATDEHNILANFIFNKLVESGKINRKDYMIVSIDSKDRYDLGMQLSDAVNGISGSSSSVWLGTEIKRKPVKNKSNLNKW